MGTEEDIAKRSITLTKLYKKIKDTGNQSETEESEVDGNFEKMMEGSDHEDLLDEFGKA